MLAGLGWLSISCVARYRSSREPPALVGLRTDDAFIVSSATLSSYRRGGQGFGPPNERRSNIGRWHVDLGFRVGHSKLGSTKQQLDRRLDLPLKLDVFNVFHRPRTPIDRKTDLGLGTFRLGLGRQESPNLMWSTYVGGGTASDRDHQRFVNLNLDTDFDYLTAYVGGRVEYYPWGVPVAREYPDWEQRLLHSRPFVSVGAEIAYVRANARGDYSIAPLTVYEDHLNVRDWLFSLLGGGGWSVPLDEYWSLNLSVSYAYHLYRPEEYNTWNFSTGLRYRF